MPIVRVNHDGRGYNYRDPEAMAAAIEGTRTVIAQRQRKLDSERALLAKLEAAKEDLERQVAADKERAKERYRAKRDAAA